jgi:hypothetical protein
MADHLGLKHTLSQSLLRITVVQHRLVIIADVFSFTAEAPPSMPNLDNTYSSLDKGYIKSARLIAVDYWAMYR